jgi:glycosyltransferase involved in cell wall biosynthesis
MNIKNKKLSYIAEINLCSKSAYKHQVLKMCDAFSELGFNVTLYIISKSDIKFNEIKKKHLLKNNFKIIALFKKKRELNFFFRVIFFIKLLIEYKGKNTIIYSRSVLSSLLYSIICKKNYLEIHQANSGFTAFLFKIFKKKILRYINFILISKNLNNILLLPNNKFLVAEDGVDIRDFNLINKNTNSEIKNSCVYTGSLHKGKGFEFIIRLAKKNKKINFFVYGDINTAEKKLLKDIKRIRNLNIMGHVNYCKIPNILDNHPVILMPYEKEVFGNHKTANLADFMSPLKMFDYLASKKIIISSKNQNIEKILKNNYNGIICSKLSLDDWSKKIIYLMDNMNLKKTLGKNAFITAKKFTWKVRVNKILKFIRNHNI